MEILNEEKIIEKSRLHKVENVDIQLCVYFILGVSLMFVNIGVTK